MIKYRVDGMGINPVEVVRETKCFVTLKVPVSTWNTKGETRVSKSSYCSDYFDTYEEARDYLLWSFTRSLVAFDYNRRSAIEKFDVTGKAYDKLLGETEYVG